MVKSMYAGITGLKTHQAKMDVIGNNIANVNTYGFKASRVTFKDVFYQTLTSSSDGTNTMGGTNAAQIGYGTAVGSIDVLHTRSGYAPTGKSSDLMIDGEGYFILGPIQVEDGTPIDSDNLEGNTLTRLGAFLFDANGNLCANNGKGVYGYSPTGEVADGVVTYDKDKLEPIKFPTYEEIGAQIKGDDIKFDGEPGDTIQPSSIAFGANGKITATVKDTEGKSHIIEVGQMAVASVPNPNGLEMVGNSEYKIGGNAGKVTAHIPSEGPVGPLVSSALEMSNVDLSNEFADMITTQRGFQANSKIITVTDEMLQELVNLKR